MHENFFKQAAEVARRATCHRARCGAVIVKDGKIIGTGYNAPPQEDEAQRMCDMQIIAKGRKPKSDKTCCVHAEWNAIIDALRNFPSRIIGSTLYFMRVNEVGEFTEAGDPYCTVCSRLALQSGIATFGLWNGGPEMINTKSYNIRSYRFFE